MRGAIMLALSTLDLAQREDRLKARLMLNATAMTAVGYQPKPLEDAPPNRLKFRCFHSVFFEESCCVPIRDVDDHGRS